MEGELKILSNLEKKKFKSNPAYQKLSEISKGDLFREVISAKGVDPLLLEEDFGNMIFETLENKELFLKNLQNKILSKPNMAQHHKLWLQKKTDELIKNNDEAGLKQLDTNINFTEKQGLIVNTPEGLLNFAPKQATYEDIKDINGIKKDSNIFTENKRTKKAGLWLSFKAIARIRESGKKICTDAQYLAAANAFPGGNILNENNDSTKVKDFFDLLGVDQLGLRNRNGNWEKNSRALWSSSDLGGTAKYMKCDDDKGHLNSCNRIYFYGAWFLED